MIRLGVDKKKLKEVGHEFVVSGLTGMLGVVFFWLLCGALVKITVKKIA